MIENKELVKLSTYYGVEYVRFSVSLSENVLQA